MTIDATFWVAISFFIFLGVLIYFKIPQKVKNFLDENIVSTKNKLIEIEIEKNKYKVDILNKPLNQNNYKNS